MTTLCELATSLPFVIGQLLDREAKLKQGRFREETLTDVLVASLAAFAGPELIIQYPDEPSTGADVDLEFWHVESGRRMLVRLQAKRLNAATNAGKPVDMRHRSYQEILHQVPSTGKYQFKTLIEESGPFLPLYIFYNHSSVVADPLHIGASPAISGVNLAFADDIARELDEKLDAKPKVLHHKRLLHLRRHFFGVEAVLCPGYSSDADPGATVPTPDAVSEALQSAWWRPRAGGTLTKDENIVLRYLLEPQAVSTSRDPRRRIPDGPAIRTSKAVSRDTVTFLSGRTDDDRTPRVDRSRPD